MGHSWSYNRSFSYNKGPATYSISNYTVVSSESCNTVHCGYGVNWTTETPGNPDDQPSEMIGDRDTLRLTRRDSNDISGGVSIPFPLEVGDSGKIQGSDYRVVTARNETVAAGTFFAFRIDYTRNEGRLLEDTTIWYAPEVQWRIRWDTHLRTTSGSEDAVIHEELLTFLAS